MKWPQRSGRLSRRAAGAASLALAAIGAFSLPPSAANADVIFCNKFEYRFYVAIAYRQQDGAFISRGWLNVDPEKCASFDSALTANGFYYRVESVPFRSGGRTVTETWGSGDGTFAILEKSNFNFWQAQSKPLNSTMAAFTKEDAAVSPEHSVRIIITSSKPATQNGAPGR